MSERAFIVGIIVVFFGSVPASWIIEGGNHDWLAGVTLTLWIAFGVVAAVAAWRRFS